MQCSLSIARNSFWEHSPILRHYTARANIRRQRRRVSSMPSAGEVCRLYRAFLREGRKFPNYNVRQYVKRRAKEEFHIHSAEADAAKVQQFWTKAQSELELVRRQAMVYTLFARKHKSIMDMPLQRVKDTV